MILYLVLTELHLQETNFAVEWGIPECLLWCVRTTGPNLRELKSLTNRPTFSGPRRFRDEHRPRSISAYRIPVSLQTKRVVPKRRKTRGPQQRPLLCGQPPLRSRHPSLRSHPKTKRNLQAKKRPQQLPNPSHRLQPEPSRWQGTFQTTTSPNC